VQVVQVVVVVVVVVVGGLQLLYIIDLSVPANIAVPFFQFFKNHRREDLDK